MNNMINNARLTELKNSYERAYNDIYTVNVLSDNNTASIFLEPIINTDSPRKYDIITGLSYREALRIARSVPATIDTENKAIKLIDKLIAYHNLDEEIGVHKPGDDDYNNLMNNFDINPDYDIFSLTPFGEVAVLFYEDRPIGVLVEDATIDDVFHALPELHRILSEIK